MDFRLGLRQDLRLRQVLRPTLKLQQALKLLTIPTLELLQEVRQELDQNPVLELEGDVSDREAEDAQEVPLSEEDDREVLHESEGELELSGADGNLRTSEMFEDGFGLRSREQLTFDPSKEFLERVPVAKTTLAENLTGQLRMMTSDPLALRIGEYLIGSLDDDGYLRQPLAEIAVALGVEEPWVERVLVELVQALEPSGVGARDLKECLLLQLRAGPVPNQLAIQIVQDHLEDFLGKRVTEIARRIHATEDQVKDAIEVLSHLDPKPAGSGFGESAQYVFPDLVVDKVEGEYVILLNDGMLERLSINSSYKHLLNGRRGRNDPTRSFVERKYRDARYLLEAVEQRRQTMVKVMQQILALQMDFFERGPAAMKPLTLKDVAERVGVHESTVSRVTSNKYVQTPRGVFPLKHFFSSRLHTAEGPDASARQAKTLIQEILAGENKSKPYSDQKIAELLKAKGLLVARRTVAKYREQLKIPSARLRRSL